ncbi:carbohydrate porin [Commensalibacter papalotli (ex Servin-Garciduenas et al. 2014)]|uniref:Carbohydrate-selective porin OprB n=1 Tax=Commensalibacter papalotli (ex Servin-Garciduenas et al. 2014) TaxID=1208583 RepID=W7DSY5_9PROT|nr:carbohydrate porin [Commensalibacter papalotli (ex Servin-Garciduenas et al. 2014)]EUK18040.1 carbohydrate-selective porin OprB [Commensalibacter papalotli (ex Servin-Garciduenas et al. 2014)]
MSIYTTLSLSLFGQQADAARSSPLLDQNAAPSSNSSSGDPTKKTPPPAKVLDQDTGQHPENDDMLLKSMWGVRPWLAQYGITFTAVDVNEVWGNPYGGIKQGAAYEGMTTLTLNWDPEKVLGFKHGLFNISTMQIRGRSFTGENIANFNPISGTEADRSTRLWELWYQQGFWDDKFTVRIGKLALDQEFNISDYAALFMNSSFGWSMVSSLDTYSGGVAYPLAAPGIRFAFQPNENWTNLFAITNDNPNDVSFCNPSGPFTCDPQSKHLSGTRFNFTTGVFIINELQYHLNPAPADEKDDSKSYGYPGTYKLGAYFDSAGFPDQRYNAQRLLLAASDTDQTKYMHNNSWSVYGIADQMIWRNHDKKHSIGLFGRIQTSPGDRSPVNLGGDGGIVYKGIFGREDDSLGLGWGFGRMSDRARQYDRDYRRLNDPTWRIRKTEHHIELAWQIQATPWWEIKPDFQYIFNPGGGLNLEEGSYKRIQNEAVFGLRSTINF